MNTQFASVVSFLGLALALSLWGPADGQLALYVVGGVDCNHSDYVTHDCKETSDAPLGYKCDNEYVGASTVQACKDELVKKDQTVCTDNNCTNVTKDLHQNNQCTKVGCGS
jgi:hypothetical protein